MSALEPPHSGTPGSDLGRMFSALQIDNYRRYFRGQAISLCGTWMQRVAQSWLILELTGSAMAVGVMLSVRTLSILALGPYGGVVADRLDKRRLMIWLQPCASSRSYWL